MDLILCNAHIYTNNPSQPVVEAIGISGGVIRVLGSLRRVKSKLPSAKIVDLEGRPVVPGLVDSHVHLSTLGLMRCRLDLSEARSVDDVLRAVAEEASRRPPGTWIIGRGWDQERLEEGRPPTKCELDEVAPRNPVVLYRVCGHVALVNSLALRLAGISEDTRDPPGGVIERDERGRPTGLLYESAVKLVEKAIPQPSVEELEEALLVAIDEGLSYGITLYGFTSASVEDLKALENLKRKGILKARVGLLIRAEDLGRLRSLSELPGYSDLYVLGVKVFIDGSLGARTAFLREDYSDMPGWRGKLTVSREELKAILREACGSRLMVAAHAIGDGAIEYLLKCAREAGIGGDMLRVEHASVAPPDLIELMSSVRVRAVVVQPHFIVSDWWIPSRLGARSRWAYPFKSMISAGLTLAGSSDAPVEPVSPWLGMWAAVVRDHSERISVTEAFNMYTIGGGRAMGLEGYGVLSEGGPADLAVLNLDPLTSPPDRLREIRSLLTLVNGVPAYDALGLLQRV